MGTFDIFDSPRAVKKIAVTIGHTDQSNGNWIEPVEVTTNIKAHISDMSLKELSFMDPAIVSIGTRKLACEASVAMKPDDRVLIIELAGEESEWIVVQKMYASNLLSKVAGVSRESFLLKRRV
uniref:Uncharacterized protein n=1 Tax=viral metagenome TaxID=1070528 RepID=A0A6M3M0L7_9ZZZZ